VLELNYSDYHLVDTGYPGWFTYGEKLHCRRHRTRDAWLRTELRRRGSGNTDLDGTNQARFRSDWHLVVGALNQDASRDINTPVNNLTSNTGTYVSSLANGFAPRFVMTSDAAYLNGNFGTGDSPTISPSAPRLSRSIVFSHQGRNRGQCPPRVRQHR